MARFSGLPLSSPLYYDKKGQLSLDKVQIHQIAKKVGTPFFLYSEQTIVKNYRDFFQGATNAGLPKPLVCFALKANGNRHLLKALAQEGCGADIVSGGELLRAIESGIPAERIVFSGVGKTSDEIKLALKYGVYSFNVESIEELRLINKLASKSKNKARICLRLNPVVKPKTHKYISTGNKTHKFGLLRSDILKAVKDKSLWKNAKLVGLSIHIGSQLLDLAATKKAIEHMGDCAFAIGVPMEFLDVGGGLGVDYHPSESKKLPTTEQYMKVVAQSLHKSYFKRMGKDCKTHVVFEPGRRIAAKAGVFVMSVLRTKTSEDQRFLIVDGGMNDFMRPSLYGAYHALLPVKKNNKKLIPTHVVGPICETSDCFATARPLPAMHEEELIVLADAGAYGFSMGSNYNLRGKPAEVVINHKGKLKHSTEPQSYQELR